MRSLAALPINIRSKITLPYLFLAVIIAIAAGYVVTQIIFDTIQERFINNLIESGKLASERMTIEESRLLATLRLLSYTNGIDEALQNSDPNLLRELSFGGIVNNQEEAVEFLDSTGKHLLSVHHLKGGNIEEYDFSTNSANKVGWEFVQKVLDQNTDDIGDKYSDWVRADWGDYFYVAGPVINDEGKFVGVILVGKTLESLAQQIREETLSQVTFYDLEGSVLASTFISPVSLPVSTVDQVIASQDQSSFRRELGRELSVQNIGYEELLGPWEGRGNNDLGLLGVSLGKSFLVNATRLTRIQVTALVVAAILFVVLVGISLASLITRPINSLVQASRQVSSGDLNVHVESTTNDELSMLVNSFNQMVANLNSSRMDLLDSYDSTLEGWSKMLELRDKETEGHAKRVVEMTVLLARELGLKDVQLEHIRRGALLHDIGKMGVPDAILLKPGKLTDEEMIIMRMHPVYAYEMLQHIDFLHPALNIPYCHHEHWNGNGYPQGLRGEEIPLEARIFALVDSWDALVSDRPYRKALPREQVVEIITKETGTHFEPRISEIFMKIAARELW